MHVIATPVRTATADAAAELYLRLRAEAQAGILEALTREYPAD